LPVGPFFKPIAICSGAVAGIAGLLAAVDDESLGFIMEGDGMAKNLGDYVGGEAQLKDPVKGYFKGDYKVVRKESKPRPLTPAKLKADKLLIPVLEAPLDLGDLPEIPTGATGTAFNFNAGGTKKVAPKPKGTVFNFSAGAATKAAPKPKGAAPSPKKKAAPKPKGTVFSPSFAAPAAKKKAAPKPKGTVFSPKKAAKPKPQAKPAKPAKPAKSAEQKKSEWRGILMPGRVEL